MHVIGVLGGVASGKSLVAQQLCELGAQRLDGDRTGHEVLRLPAVEAAARARWGEEIFDEHGRIDRRRLAHIVFGPPPGGTQELKFLEQLTHPLIGLRLRQQAEHLAAEGQTPAVVLDAPVMLKAGWDRMCDQVLFVDAPRNVRLERAMRRGWTEEQFHAREQAQESLEVKRARAEVIIDNSGTPEQTRDQVVRFWNNLIE